MIWKRRKHHHAPTLGFDFPVSLSRLRRGFPAASVLATVLLALVFGLDAAAPAIGAARGVSLDHAAAARVTINIRLGAGRTGTFRMTGGFSDSGRIVAKRNIAGGRLRLTQTMTGTNGTLVISSSHACARATGQWKVVSGGGSYRGASGGGTASGRIGCKRPWKASTVAYTGSLTTPPPALAAAGAYGGWTPQDEWIEFEIAPSGRSVLNLAVSGFSWECVSASGFREKLSSKRDRMAGPFPIAEDRTFAIQMWPAVTISGRFTSAGAEGTITVPEYAFTDPYGQPSTCSGEILWKVSTPPPPPRRALPGTYCGFTTANNGVCLDVPEGGREFRNLRVGAILNCGQTRFLLELTLDMTVSLGPTLTFEHRFTQPIPGGEPVVAVLRGSFDQAGAGAGFLSLVRPSFTYEGTQYTCTGGGASWTVKLQG